MFIRAFFIQALWNFERMQNIGFLFILKPFLYKIYLNKDKRKEAFLRHAVFFNTHPYLANIIIAIVVNMEKKIAESGLDEKVLDINIIKNTMTGPLAAIGDSLFWGTLRPLASFVSIFMVVLFAKALNNRFESYSILIPLVFIVFYNIVHLPVRYWFMFMGFKLDKESIVMLSKLEFKILLEMVRYSGVVIIVATLFLYLKIFGFGSNGIFFGTNIYDIFVYSTVLILSVFASGKFGAVFLFYGIILICIIMSYLGI
ncbi:MAG: PTS system mannose/fructose/sorbose family transporter subunit IID [Endomicrobium sp.]|nr:PTS system mannose/fructose/sorbose family transporter subunit IID [Endomicrobium sp.]